MRQLLTGDGYSGKPWRRRSCLRTVLKQDLSNTLFFALLLLVLLGILKLLSPFAGSLLAAFCLAIVFDPLHEKTKRWWPRLNPSVRSALVVLAVVVFLGIPLALLGWSIAAESENMSVVLKKWGATVQEFRQGDFSSTMPWMQAVMNFMHRVLGLSTEEIQQRFVNKFAQGLGAITAFGADIAQHALNFVFHLFIMLFTFFFFLKDGKTYRDQIANLIPLSVKDTREILQRVHDIIVGVVRGWLLTSIVQGICAAIGYFIVGLQAAVLLGVLTAAIGLLPVIGTLGVWIPVAAFLFLKGMVWKGVFILFWGGFVVVGLNDTLIRPYLVGQRAEMPILYLFFALLGGAEIWGAKGIVLGPLLVAVAPLLLEIYRQKYLHRPEV
jgi:predicted PurR-regulated permease PerM